MTLQVIIGFNPEALSAISELTAAIRGLSGGAVTTTAVKTAASAKPEGTDADPDTVIWWADNIAGTFGTVDSEDALKALKKKVPKLVKITEAKYKEKVAEAAKKAADAKKASTDAAEIPSEDDLIKAFSAYLPATGLDEKTKKERRLFVKALSTRFGAEKASQIGEADRALAINLVLRKAAGQDIDPEDAEYEEFDAENAEADDDDGI